MTTQLKEITKIINQTNDIYNDEKNGLTLYRFYEKGTWNKTGEIILKICEDSCVADYKTNNKWFTESNIKQEHAIKVNWLESNIKGMGSLILAYGVLDMARRYKRIKYSILDDDSDQSRSITQNIYSKFGYTPTHATKRTGYNTVSLSGPEKQVTIREFIEKTKTYLMNTQSKSRRSYTRRNNS